jgi:hypothetical protein
MHRQHVNNSSKYAMIIISILMYSVMMWYACTSSKRWLGHGLDGSKQQWEQRMAAAGLE